MADEETTNPEPAPTPAGEATPKKSAGRKRTAPAAAAAAPAAEPKAKKATPETRAPRRPTLDPEIARLLRARDAADLHRPLFVRQAAHRYARIGRDGAWRRPRGLQSKQRRHYGFRSRIVRIGFGSPRLTRGLTPTGFRPVLVRTEEEIAPLDTARDAVVIARTVGTRRRLALEEACRRRGLHVLNPIVREREES